VAHPADPLAAAPVVGGGDGDGADRLGGVGSPVAGDVPVGVADPADPLAVAPVADGGAGNSADPPGGVGKPVGGAVAVGVADAADPLPDAPVGGVGVADDPVLSVVSASTVLREMYAERWRAAAKRRSASTRLRVLYLDRPVFTAMSSLDVASLMLKTAPSTLLIVVSPTVDSTRGSGGSAAGSRTLIASSAARTDLACSLVSVLAFNTSRTTRRTPSPLTR